MLHIFTPQSITEDSQGGNSRQEPGAGTEAETTEKGLLACSQRLVQPACCCTPGLPVQGGPVHSGLAPSTIIVNQENAPQPCLCRSDGGIFSIEAPPLR